MRMFIWYRVLTTSYFPRYPGRYKKKRKGTSKLASAGTGYPDRKVNLFTREGNLSGRGKFLSYKQFVSTIKDNFLDLRVRTRSRTKRCLNCFNFNVSILSHKHAIKFLPEII